MMLIKPATLHGSDDARLAGLAARLCGERLVCARYVTPAGVGWENYSDLEGVDEVDMGVEMITESGLILELSWATPGREEGISLSLVHKEERSPNELVDVVDVSDRQGWAAILGRLVEVVAVSFHIHSDDSSIRPWSFRVGVSDSSSVTIGLGEVSDHSLRYQPDNLVIIFDEVAARNYEIVDGLQSAWGEIVLHGEC